jgi:hypothetical protein
MKKTIAAALLSLTMSQAFASDYYCKPAFQKKMKNVQTTSKIMGGTFLSAIGTGLVAGAVATEATIGAVMPPVALVLVGDLLVWRYIVSPLEYRIEKAEVLLLETRYSREENLFNQEDAFNRNRAIFLNQQSRIGEGRDIELDVEGSLLTIPYFLNEPKGQQWGLRKPYDRTKAKLMSDFIADKINEKRTSKVSYEEVAQIIRDHSTDDTFCPKNTAASLNKIQKIIESKL